MIVMNACMGFGEVASDVFSGHNRRPGFIADLQKPALAICLESLCDLSSGRLLRGEAVLQARVVMA